MIYIDEYRKVFDNNSDAKLKLTEEVTITLNAIREEYHNSVHKAIVKYLDKLEPYKHELTEEIKATLKVIAEQLKKMSF